VTSSAAARIRPTASEAAAAGAFCRGDRRGKEARGGARHAPGGDAEGS
jgi:hypothetical protein